MRKSAPSITVSPELFDAMLKARMVIVQSEDGRSYTFTCEPACTRPGCSEPRRLLGSGVYASYCIDHHREAGIKSTQVRQGKPGKCQIKGCTRRREKFDTGKYGLRCYIHRDLRHSEEKRDRAKRARDLAYQGEM